MAGTNRVLLFANGASYLVTTIRQAIENNGNEVIQINSDDETIPQVTYDIDAILMYLDTTLVDRTDILIFVKDLASEKRIPIFLIGIPEEIGTVCKTVPTWIIKERYVRPVDCNEVAREINEFLVENKRRMLERKTILAVDDSGVFLRQINSWLEEKYQIVLANSGLNAMKYLGSHKPDLILLDYEMPICNGKQVLEMIRSDAESEDIPVIFLTGNGNRESIIEIMSYNVSGYLLKTLPANEIIKYVDTFFEKKRAQENLAVNFGQKAMK